MPFLHGKIAGPVGAPDPGTGIADLPTRYAVGGRISAPHAANGWDTSGDRGEDENRMRPEPPELRRFGELLRAQGEIVDDDEEEADE